MSAKSIVCISSNPRRASALLTAALLCVAAPVVAQTPTSPPPALSAEAANDAARQLLAAYPAGGAQLISAIRSLLIADITKLRIIVAAVSLASPEQKAAIGAGMAQASRILLPTNQAAALQIQEAVALLDDRNVATAYAAVVGDRPIAATTGAASGAGAGGGGSGGQINGLPGQPSSTGAAQPILGGSARTYDFTYSSSVSGTGGTTTFSTYHLPTSP